MKRITFRNQTFIRVVFILFTLFVGIIPQNVLADGIEYKKFSTKENVPFNKVWTITMSKPLKQNTVNSQNVKVTDSQGNYIGVKVSLGEKNNLIKIEPPTGGYKLGETYNILVSTMVESEKSGRLKQGIKTVFTVEQSPKIEFFRLEHEPFISGDKLKAFINTQLNRDVQYNIFLYDKKNNKYTSITQGYSQSVKGKEPLLVAYDKDIEVGEYSLIAYIKRAGVKGLQQDSRADYDDIKELQFIVLAKNDKELISVNNDIKLNGNNFTKVDKGYSYKIGEKISIDKIENISGRDANYKYKLHAYNLTNPLDIKDITKYGDKLDWIPPEAGDYILEVWVKSYSNDTSTEQNTDKDSQQEAVKVDNSEDETVYHAKKLFYVQVFNKEIRYVDYDITLEEFVKIESTDERAAVSWVDGEWKRASEELVGHYVNPENFTESEYGMYQFLTLNHIEGISVEDLNNYLKGRGILEGKGASFLEAAKKDNINVAYLVAHAILETGHGKSKLANGIEVTSVDGKAVEPKVTYNMYGIGAYDVDANRLGSEYAYKQGWFTPEKAIIEGAAWIGKGYINSEKYNQNTLYKMRWNVDVVWHQYSTDVRWAYNQIQRIKEFLDKSTKAYLIFEVPRFKEE